MSPLVPQLPSSFQNAYGAAIGTLGQVNKVVDSLYAKVHPLLFLASGMFLQYCYRHKELSSDPTIRSHLAVLYDTLLQWVPRNPMHNTSRSTRRRHLDQQHLLHFFNARLSQMILDEVFHGVLDQGRGCLIAFDEPEADNTYGAAIETLVQVSEVVDSLYAKVRPLLLLASGMFLRYCYRHKELSSNPTIRSHLAVLYDTLLQWILRLAVTDSTSFWMQKRSKNGAQADAEDMKEDGNDDIDKRYDGKRAHDD
ncbi:hypothetical protein AZE42_12027 [Rhizopogon vesiculosus]|uniref:6S proteasome subunit Rpn6 C-terminal helix domain-containing protein n=1 Tax=Rhizopogon vesiculosus TaxID=180088 RepID=A0A1J8PGL9_9AGAM|nr:hypothetical protein AZE42_12027 [Rhizopogon vesiculosus]